MTATVIPPRLNGPTRMRDVLALWVDELEVLVTTPRPRGAPVEPEPVTDLKTMPYQDYLRTKHWQSIRRRALDYAGDRCQLCGKGGALHVHHSTYERRGEERPSDVVVLCRGCHARHHRIRR